MPDESMWTDFFDAETVLRKLGLTPSCDDVVDFGCGYGTFTIPAARMIPGTVHALDIEPEMVQATATKAQEARLQNVKTCLRDFDVLIKLNQIASVIWIGPYRRARPRRTVIEMRT